MAQLESKEGDNKKIGFTNQNNKWAIKPQYSQVNEFYDYPVAAVNLKGKWGFINWTGQVVIPFKYTNVDYVDNHQALVIINGKYGLVNLRKGIEWVPCLYDDGAYFNKDLPLLGLTALVIKNKKHGLLDSLGREIMACVFDLFSIEQSAYGFINANIDKKAGVLDTKGHFLVPCTFESVNEEKGLDSLIYFSTTKGNKHGLYSAEGKLIADCAYDNYIMFDTDGFAIVQLKNKYGLIDKTGKMVLPCTYDNDDNMLPDRDKLRKK
jgi:hypothetical protein